MAKLSAERRVSLESYLLFVGASLLLVIVPGPDMLYLLTRCVAQGRRAGLIAALGINLGAYVHLIAALTGLSAVLATSATAFTVLKWAGAAYLVYLGMRALLSRDDGDTPSIELRGRSDRAIFWQGFLSDALNPKVAVFYVALLPQFIDAKAANPLGQLVLLGVTVNMVGIAGTTTLVLASSKLTEGLRRNRTVTLWLRKAMGVVFVSLGLRLATERA